MLRDGDLIMVVEDDRAISEVLRAYLEADGLGVEQAYSCREAMDKFRRAKPSLVLLDVMLPDGSGRELLARIRKLSACPVIMLTVVSDVDFKVETFHAGADDYVLKPFDGKEVVARVNALLRRPAFTANTDAAQFGSLRLDFAARHGTLAGSPLGLTPREFAVLELLARHPNQTISREQLIEQVWGFDYEGTMRVVDMTISRIRQSIDGWPEDEGQILTVHGLGYRLRV